jgi:hypothetical protein
MAPRVRGVYYDGKLFTVNMMEVNASDPLIAKNKSINEIYASNDLDEEQEFLSVIDAIPTDGMNPLWRQGLEAIRRSRTIHGFYSRSALEQRQQARATRRLLAQLLDQLRSDRGVAAPRRIG